jgi:hypothetical protein
METLGRQPTDNAEKSLYDFFNSLTLEGVSWFNLDIPGINEIDCIGWFKDYGFFAIETKGFKLKDFKDITLDNITFSSQNHQSKYGHKNPPWKQARIASRLLATFLSNIYYQKRIFPTKDSKQRFSYLPYIFSFTYFPFISEKDFKNAFPNSYGILSDYILFNDCHLDVEYFKNKLKRIGENQVRNNPQNRTDEQSKKVDYNKLIAVYTPEIAKLYKEKIFILQPESNKDDKYDTALLKLLESKDLTEELNELNFDFPVFRYGYAGTGKTLIALKILQKFAIENKQVLFTCYNKVLATDLRRFNKLSYEEAYRYFDNITIKDIHSLIYEYSPFSKFINFNVPDNQIDNYFDTIVNEIIMSGYFKGVFEYIVIDEAQDLKDYGWKLIMYLAKRESASLIVLNGKEQNLYLEKPSIYLTRFEDKCKKIQEENNLKSNYKQKRRIYRNKTRTFLLAQTFLDDYPEISKSTKFIQDNETKKDPTFEFTRQAGNFPYIINKVNSHKNFRGPLKKAILHCLSENETYGLGASGILIIVPFKFSSKMPINNFYRNIAVDTLNELKLDFIDYTIEDNRRLDYLINQVRIVSFHSCRGIEANFTMILGFEELFHISETAHCDYHKLGYIILSRAKYETYIFIDSTKSKPNTTKFLDFSKTIFNTIDPDEKFIYDI